MGNEMVILYPNPEQAARPGARPDWGDAYQGMLPFCFLPEEFMQWADNPRGDDHTAVTESPTTPAGTSVRAVKRGGGLSPPATGTQTPERPPDEAQDDQTAGVCEIAATKRARLDGATGWRKLKKGWE